MAIIDTTNWITNDNLRSMSNEGLTAFVNNISNAYTLLESEFRTFATFDNDDNGYRWQEYRWDIHQVPFLVSNVPTFEEGSLVTYGTLSHGKSVRPYQHLTWTASGGQHMHMIPVIDSVTARYRKPLGHQYLTNPQTFNTMRFAFRFYYGSVSTNYSFPNFNDAAPEFDIWMWQASDDSKWCKIENWPITTTGAGSNIVLSTTAPGGNFMRRGTYGV